MEKIFKQCFAKGKKFCNGYFIQLLISLVLLFIFRPYDRGPIYLAIWEFLLTLVFLSAIFNCDHSKKIKKISICLAIPALIFEWLNLFYPLKIFSLLFLGFMIVFIFITTGSIIKKVVINARVKLETLKGVVCAYFMVAFGFSFCYFFVDLIAPGSFSFSNLDSAMLTHSHYLSELMYFSFVTLLCTGYGDIIAVKDIAQTLAILEGIVGQFYIAILVSRLVSVYSFFEHKLHLVQKK